MTNWTTAQLEAFPLEEGPNPQYWGRGCQGGAFGMATLSSTKKLVILSGPMRSAEAGASGTTDSIGPATNPPAGINWDNLAIAPSKAVQRKANGLCRTSKVGDLMTVVVCETTAGAINLHWEVNRAALYQAERRT
ncbi:MAG: hypothetical protein IPM76_22340 [Chloroflexi bacterium]|nr:hypothetical protein [Chloroflexota bacterium]